MEPLTKPPPGLDLQSPTPSPLQSHWATTVGGGSSPSTPLSSSLTGSRSECAYVSTLLTSPMDGKMHRIHHASRHSLSSCDSSPARLMSMTHESSGEGDAEHRVFVQGHKLEDDIFAFEAEQNGAQHPDSKSTVNDVPRSCGDAAVPGLSPRQDGKAQAVTAENAQAVLKPKACLFVANLQQYARDTALAAAVTRSFSQFGKCHVKIKRDSRMPVAFVQYHTEQDAAQAYAQGAGLEILGRMCRVEWCKAPRLVCVSRRDGKMPSAEEIHLLFLNRGELERKWIPAETDRDIHNLPLCYFVRFAFHPHAVEAVKDLRDSLTYRVEPYPPPKRRNSGHHTQQQYFSSAGFVAPPFHPAYQISQAVWLPSTMMRANQAGLFGGHNTFYYAGNMTYNGHPAYVSPTRPSFHANHKYGNHDHHNGHSSFQANFTSPNNFAGHGFGDRNRAPVAATYGYGMHRNVSQMGNHGFHGHYHQPQQTAFQTPFTQYGQGSSNAYYQPQQTASQTPFTQYGQGSSNAYYQPQQWS